MTTPVVLAGRGRLGSIIADVINASDEFTIERVLDSSSTPEDILGAELVVDATVLAASEPLVRTAMTRGIPIVVATSGWTSAKLDALTTEFGDPEASVVVIPNFSLGSVVESVLAGIAAPYFDSVEIVEAHHAGKVDSPSGTAVRTAEHIADARRAAGLAGVVAPFADQPARGELIAGVPVHSLRRPGVVAKQDVIFSGPGESLTLTHDTIDPARAYAPGILAALRYAVASTGLTVGLDKVLGVGA